jgi:hypothetical protein
MQETKQNSKSLEGNMTNNQGERCILVGSFLLLLCVWASTSQAEV